MKAKDLLNALALPMAVSSKKTSTVQAVSHLCITDGKVLAFNFSSAAEIELDLGVRCAPPTGQLHAALNAIAQVAPEADVKIAMKGHTLTLSAPRVRHSMPTLPVEDFPVPAWPTETQPVRDWKALADSMRFVKPASGTVDVRKYLNSVASHEGHIAASDGHRAHIDRGASQLPNGLIIPIEQVPAICDLVDVTASAASETALAFHFKGGRFYTARGEGKYPDIVRVTTVKPAKEVAVAKREDLAAGLSAIRKTKFAKWMALTLRRDSIVLEESGPDGSGATVEVPCTYAGDDVRSGFDSLYVFDACQALTGEHLTLSWQDAGSPLLITGDRPSRAVVVMPVRI